MSSIRHLLGRLFAGLFAPVSAVPDPETMNLREWADLPPHHPVRDRAPC